MVRLTKGSAKTSQPPNVAPKKAGRKKGSAVPKTALADVQKCKQHGIDTHLQANNTRTNYAGHVRRGREWLASHFDNLSRSATSTDNVSKDSPALSMLPLPAGVATDADDDIYDDPAFKDVFDSIPNGCSDKALALFMSLKGFHENLSKTTVESIRSAFKKLWELSDGDRFRGKWHFNEAKQCWEGNPADSADVYDVLSSVKHKASAEGGDRTHSMAMTKDYMNQTLRWHQATCPLEIALQMIWKVMSGTQPSDVHLDLETRSRLTRHLEQVTFEANAWTLWTRCELPSLLKTYLTGKTLALSECQSHFKIFLSNRKGWQRKVDKGQWEADLRSNHYKIYPRPDILACDNFFWTLVWIKWLEHFHYGHSLQPNDFIFPAMGASGVVQPGQPISHDTVQKWINEATTGAGILSNFSTHCFRRGGAQYWFMFAPVGQRWTLAKVRWWGGWAEGEHRDTLVRYLLDELHAYENDYSDALAPISRGANTSLAGEQALMRPALPAPSHWLVCAVSCELIRCASESHTPRPTPPYTPSREGGHLTATHRPSPRAVTSQSSILASQRPAATKTTPPSKNTTSQSLPTAGLVIPRVPVTRPNGTTSPKSKSWKEIVEHWLVGDPDRGLRTPLKDWPKEWYQGANRRFASKYHQRATIALEFINEYESNESRFLAAYPEAEMGHTQLLKAINEARAALVQRVSRKK
ncbi:hypothetical protein DEU56DRAFT_734911 [Suillus clintonianus]|uniref:uncharacterized protein n=1 Tax=Suillus clintonianus TaxID=1904413 RepID=UPI001B880271|nr:uncharacterized protein DEU56DRAFT_734911 [Suillus clintonianus]KAG2140603.1 hypothetical protein DEU56DRAFT_734911 [Suillus clintonianus]